MTLEQLYIQGCKKSIVIDFYILSFFVIEYTKIFTFLYEYRICCFLYFFSACFDILYSIFFFFLEQLNSSKRSNTLMAFLSQINISINHWRRSPFPQYLQVLGTRSLETPHFRSLCSGVTRVCAALGGLKNCSLVFLKIFF